MFVFWMRAECGYVCFLVGRWRGYVCIFGLVLVMLCVYFWLVFVIIVVFWLGFDVGYVCILGVFWCGLCLYFG